MIINETALEIMRLYLNFCKEKEFSPYPISVYPVIPDGKWMKITTEIKVNYEGSCISVDTYLNNDDIEFYFCLEDEDGEIIEEWEGKVDDPSHIRLYFIKLHEGLVG